MDRKLIGALAVVGILLVSGLYFAVNHRATSNVQGIPGSSSSSNLSNGEDRSRTTASSTFSPYATSGTPALTSTSITTTSSRTEFTLPVSTTTTPETVTTTTSNAVTVTFVVSVPDCTPPGDFVYIAGNFNGWNPGDENYRLTKLSDGRWAINLTFPYGAIIEFKFTRGSWETVEVGPKGEEIQNRRFVFTNPGTYEFQVYKWKDCVEGSMGHTVTGNVKTFKVFIPQLNETRRVWVYLPPDYNTSKRSYPVLYMFDGQDLFDNATATTVEWGVDESLQRLYNESGFSLIVVGIESGRNDGIREYNATLDFIVHNLVNFTKLQYRIDPSRTGIMGSSIGGVMAIYAGFAYPDTFRYVGSMSAEFWLFPGIYDYVKNAPSGPKRIYIDWGTNEGSVQSKISEANEKMVSILKDKGYEEDVNLKVVVDEGGTHSPASWGRRFPQAVLWLFGG